VQPLLPGDAGEAAALLPEAGRLPRQVVAGHQEERRAVSAVAALALLLSAGRAPFPNASSGSNVSLPLGSHPSGSYDLRGRLHPQRVEEL
jgi:hypothetical protein